MNTKNLDYSKSDLIRGLNDAGIESGDTVFTQVGFGFLGVPKDCLTTEDTCKMILDSFLTVLGKDGTLLVPTYTYSFCENQVFDVQNTPSTIGSFTEYFRVQKNVIRSQDPIFSVAGLGPKAVELLTKLPHTCFGKDSVYQRLEQIHGKICMIGLELHYNTFRKHIEEMVGIPARFIKKFSGKIKNDKTTSKETWSYYVRHLVDNCYPDGRRLEKKVRSYELCKIAKVGRGEILVVDSHDYFNCGFKALQKDPWITSRGPPLI